MTGQGSITKMDATKMDANETQSVSICEQPHPAEMAACDKEADWK